MRIWNEAKETAATMTFALMEHDFSKSIEETIYKKIFCGFEKPVLC